MCRVAHDATPYSGSSMVSEAACLIRTHDTVLMVRHRSSALLALPSGAVTLQESPRCGAHRAVWEKTGLNVEVGRLLTHTDSGNPVFHCRSEVSLADLPARFEAPHWASSKITRIERVSPFELNQAQLHEPDTFIPVRDAFVLAPSHIE
ncbi:NUDIX hydrolase [Alteromonas gilva]|uniref:NUDIX domain-containing protein n=1 Tax=Alteromonas gilva TaxID=2987522 RepID=A0ABT5KYW3_9ALTE|nr:NUDIX domain-containing protein [Alteromonas gilva]MDC8829964.1 NUDIX domain-containing protein [Alteromonas gilva]